MEDVQVCVPKKPGEGGSEQKGTVTKCNILFGENGIALYGVGNGMVPDGKNVKRFHLKSEHFHVQRKELLK